MSESEFSIEVVFQKVLERGPERRLVGGFAYVAKSNGRILFDTQGDSIDPEDLREAVHEFVKAGRSLGIMHLEDEDGKVIKTGEIVEMAVLGGDFMPPGMSRDQEGLWIVAKVEDEAVWELVKNGTLRAFSIGGRGQREVVVE